MSPSAEHAAARVAVAQATATWVKDFVVGEGLCPFARAPAERDGIVYKVTFTEDSGEVAEELAELIVAMQDNETIETSFLVHPFALQNFGAYNNFLDVAEGLLKALGLERKFQIASFHPAYLFDEVDKDDPANYSNRSPFAMLHVLRQASVGAAVDAHPDAEAIPSRNVSHLRAMGTHTLATQLERLREQAVGVLAAVAER